MKIGMGKLGLSTHFNNRKFKVGAEEQAQFCNLARLNPQNTYYWMSKSRDLDVTNEEMFPNGNAVNAWGDFNPKIHDEVTYLGETIPKLDFMIVHSGACSTYSIPGQSLSRKGTPRKNIFMIMKYSSHILYWLNVSETPYMWMCNDPRNFRFAPRDVWHRPSKLYAQSSYEYDYLIMKAYEEQIASHPIKEKVEYYPIEKTRLIDSEYPNFEYLLNNKTSQIGIICNEGSDTNGCGMMQPRYPILKEYILDNFKSSEIYGKWKGDHSADSRFKGVLQVNELNKKTVTWKYSLCIPIGIDWATAKYVELMQHGVIPFLHHSYDSQNNSKMPDFCRVKDPRDFLNKINILENDHNKYLELWSELQKDHLKPEFFTGEHFNNFIRENIIEITGKDPGEQIYSDPQYRWILNEYEESLFSF